MITGEHFLAEAVALLKTSRNDPVRRRTVASRAYYAAFHKTLDVAEKLDYKCDFQECRSMKRLGSHADLIDWLANHKDLRVRQISSRLKLLKGLRVKADYDLSGNHIDYGRAKDMVDEVTFIIQELCPELEPAAVPAL